MTVHADMFESLVSGERYPGRILQESVLQLQCCVSGLLHSSWGLWRNCGVNWWLVC